MRHRKHPSIALAAIIGLALVACYNDSLSPVTTEQSIAGPTASAHASAGNNGVGHDNSTNAWVTTALGLDQFSLIPAGTFDMGSSSILVYDNGAINDQERPVHTVTISRAFYMQKTEVTQGQWRAVMGSNPSHFPKCGDSCPVEQVSWLDVVDQFLPKLNAMTPGVTYRLPTEAEWEYAARAGTTGDYAGDLDAMGWYLKNSHGRTHPAATKQANAWNLYDMHGNVIEWVHDWYGLYSALPVTDPSGPDTSWVRPSRVARGGAWNSAAIYARSAGFRSYPDPFLRYGGLGFRLVRMP